MNVLAITSQIIDKETFASTFFLLPAMIAGGLVSGKVSKTIPRYKFQILVVNGLRVVGFTFLPRLFSDSIGWCCCSFARMLT
jgi:hypothetical protein